ncbi:MAG: hypothetical protein LUB59_00465 [Candidatus Gastranaerophilales bacterium]|nr:hypothetical protein [Candidatus Gastranaerophilales bacterium]
MKKMLISIMLVNNNVYSFLGGIFVSLSTSIFATLCFERSDFMEAWYIYAAVLLFVITGALCMYLAAKLSKFQNYIMEKHITDYSKKRTIAEDASRENWGKWISVYMLTGLTGVGGVFMLAMNFIMDGTGTGKVSEIIEEISEILGMYVIR